MVCVFDIYEIVPTKNMRWIGRCGSPNNQDPGDIL